MRRTGGREADGVVAAVVPELELESLAAERLAQQLVAHADAEDRLLADHLAHVLHCVGDSAGIALHRDPTLGRFSKGKASAGDLGWYCWKSNT